MGTITVNGVVLAVDELKSRLLRKRRVDEITGCWIWTGAKTSAKKFAGIRGMMRINRKDVSVSRLSAAVFNGFDLSSPLFVRHSCDRPLCFKPEHLLPGTAADNVRDMVMRGRKPTGAAAGKTHLTEAGVVEMKRLRSIGVTCQDVGDRFGVCRQAVSRIVRGQRWPGRNA